MTSVSNLSFGTFFVSYEMIYSRNNINSIYMKKTLATAMLALTITLPEAYAQKTDKNSLGTIYISSYPTLPIDMNFDSYQIVDGNNKIIQFGSPIYNNIYGTSKRFTKSSIENGADYTIQISGLTNSTDEIDVVKAKPPKGKPGPGPKPDMMFVGYGSKLIGFFVDIYAPDGNRIFTDSVFERKNYETRPLHDPKLAEFKIDSMYRADQNPENKSGFNLPNQVARYRKTIASALGLDYMTAYRFHVYSVKQKKNSQYDYSDLIKAAEVFEKEAVPVVDKNDMNIDKFRSKAGDCFATWQNALADANNPRITKEIKAALYYNLATYYVFVKDFQKAIESYNKAADEVDDFGDTEKVIKYAKEWDKAQKRYEAMMEAQAKSDPANASDATPSE